MQYLNYCINIATVKYRDKEVNFILMADIVDSRKTGQQQLMHDFKKIVGDINKQYVYRFAGDSRRLEDRIGLQNCI